MTLRIAPARRIAASASLMAAMLMSCATPAPTMTAQDGAAAPPAETPTAPKSDGRVNGRIAAEPNGNNGPLVREDGSGAIVGRPQTQARVMESGDITLNYVDADIREAVRLILGDILKVNYSIDPGFQGTVTIQTTRPLKREELLPTLQALLAQAGGMITYQNGIFRIGAAGDETIIPPVVDGASAEAGSQVVPLRFASARQLASVLANYIGDGAKIIGDPARNVLLVSGSAAARQNVIDLIRVFDVDYLAGQSYALFPAKSGEPAKMASDLEAALQLGPDGPLAGTIKIVAVEQANAIMVIAQQPLYLDRVARLIEQLDRVKESADRSIHIYFLKNAQAADIQPLLQRAINPPNGGAADEIAPGNLPPTAEPAQIAALGGAAANPIAMRATPTGPGGQPAPGLGSNPGPQASVNSEPETSGGNPKGPQIIADKADDALLVVATEFEYASIAPAIRKLDVLPMQVLVEATVAEVTLNDSLQYGTQFFLHNSIGQVGLSNAQNATPTIIDPTNPLTNAQLFAGALAPGLPGFQLARTVGEAQYALQALRNVTDVQIISAPKLFIMDKQEASFQVGDLVPTITQSATSVITADAPIVNNVQYQATGVILTVTPRINSGGLVTLDIDQEVSDVVPTTSSSINSPTFEQRKIKTKVVVQDGETISLAGLISDKKSKQNSGIPLLQNLPVLGPLFSTRTNSSERTELLILLTPHVVYDQHDARALTEELRRKLAPANLMP